MLVQEERNQFQAIIDRLRAENPARYQRLSDQALQAATNQVK